MQFSCNTNDNDISEISLERPLWLETEIKSREQDTSEDINYCYILEGEYENETVFIFGDCNPVLNKITPVYNYQGDSIGFLEVDFLSDTITNNCLIWKPDEFSCLILFGCSKVD